jgi:hypothetical protein
LLEDLAEALDDERHFLIVELGGVYWLSTWCRLLLLVLCRLECDGLSFGCGGIGMKTVSEFFGIPETDFEIFRSDSSITVFFENGIGFRNFLSESVSESAWCFTDRFHRLPVFVGNYRICVSEISGIVSRNFFGIFFGIFQHVIFSHRLYISG